MKFSLVLAVYNGESSLSKCLDAVLNLNYPKDKYELIVVDDRSTDGTYELLDSFKFKFKNKKISYRIFKLKNNQGRIKARLFGAKKAKFNRIVIYDVQLKMDCDFLQKASKYPSSTHIISNVYMNKHIDIFNRFFYLVRKGYYGKFWKKKFSNVVITHKNFTKIAKGTGGFITNRRDFIKYSLQLGAQKVSNDDTKLFKIYLNNDEKLLKVYDAKSLYRNRSGFPAIKHIFHRGPKFVNFYFSTLKQLLFIMVNLLLFFILLSMIFKFGIVFLIYFVMITLIIDVAVSTYLSQLNSFKDFLSSLLLFPIFSITFYLGLFYGSILNLFNKYF